MSIAWLQAPTPQCLSSTLVRLMLAEGQLIHAASVTQESPPFAMWPHLRWARCVFALWQQRLQMKPQARQRGC